MKKQNILLGLAALAMASLSAPAFADVHTEQKIMQFGGPETRTRCIKEWKTLGPPNCRLEGGFPPHLVCEDNWISGCSEWATDFYQHEIFLTVDGPEVADALRQPLIDALNVALGAAVGAAVATPGEVGIKTAAGFAAFKIAVVAELGKIGLADIAGRYSINVAERGHW